MQNRNFIVTEQLLSAVLGYLSTKPYDEVFEMIATIQSQAKEHVEETETPDGSY